ncbi:MAG TPA: hypothetical protein VEG38_00690 [Acidimicrobiia bacterium]|nr:hypothetical protein [Acidimicrobiia bacterium]
MEQVVQLVGALLILSAYIASQQNRMRNDSVEFLGLNTAGAVILAVIAAVNRDYGFLLLEAVWTVVSARGLVRAINGQPETRPPAAKRRPNRPSSRPARRRNRPNPLRRVE